VADQLKVLDRLPKFVNRLYDNERRLVADNFKSLDVVVKRAQLHVVIVILDGLSGGLAMPQRTMLVRRDTQIDVLNSVRKP
jgi:hypothetical protein